MGAAMKTITVSHIKTIMSLDDPQDVKAQILLHFMLGGKSLNKTISDVREIVGDKRWTDNILPTKLHFMTNVKLAIDDTDFVAEMLTIIRVRSFCISNLKRIARRKLLKQKNEIVDALKNANTFEMGGLGQSSLLNQESRIVDALFALLIHQHVKVQKRAVVVLVQTNMNGQVDTQVQRARKLEEQQIGLWEVDANSEGRLCHD